MCALYSLAAVMPVLDKAMISEKIVPILVEACKDRIPNVQFCVARIIKEKFSHFDTSVFNSQLVPKLKDMSQESDKDVAYYATLALQES